MKKKKSFLKHKYCKSWDSDIYSVFTLGHMPFSLGSNPNEPVRFNYCKPIESIQKFPNNEHQACGCKKKNIVKIDFVACVLSDLFHTSAL